MKVFRIEDEHGQGPYHNWVMRAKLERHLENDSRSTHPDLWEDGIRRPNSDYYCGLKSVEALRQWFNDKELKALHRGGYQFAVYNVPTARTVQGARQLIFDKTRSKLVSLEPATSLIK